MAGVGPPLEGLFRSKRYEVSRHRRANYNRFNLFDTFRSFGCISKGRGSDDELAEIARRFVDHERRLFHVHIVCQCFRGR